MTSSCRVRTQVVADRAHRGMKEKSDVADRELGDLADFLVAQVALELEMDDFALVARKSFDDCQDPAERLSRVVSFVEVAGHGNRTVLEAGQLHASRLLSLVERQVPAHREQPRRHMPVDPRRILPAQPQERLLHDIPGRVEVAQEPFRIADQRLLMELQRVDDPLGLWRPAHSASTGDNARAPDLLGSV